MSNSIYDIKIKGIHGVLIDLNEYRGKKMLIINTASNCGFTKQYAELQVLHEKFSDVLTVIGVPCNQFGGQEPGNSDDISKFCEINYGVTFALTEKVDVKGPNQHPLYTWLTQKKFNGVKN